MYEHHTEPLLPFTKFLRRLARSIASILSLVAASLCVGTAGYKFTEDMGWMDAFYNASLILSGMGPAAELHTDGGKIFASFYALYSGLFVILATGILLVPVFHRVLHKFHIKEK